MAPLGDLTQGWTAAEAALPLGWHIAGVWRFDDTYRLLIGIDARSLWRRVNSQRSSGVAFSRYAK